MKEFFKEIFEYHQVFNEQLAAQLMEHQTQIGEKSFALFSHLLNAHQIWNSRILGTTSLGVNDLHDLKYCMTLNRDNYVETLSIIEKSDFSSVIRYQNSKGAKFSNTVRDILFHVINHTTHHRGQIIMDLRSKGIDPIITDYIFYKRATEEL